MMTTSETTGSEPRIGATQQRPGVPGMEVHMNRNGKSVLLTVAILFATLTAAWSSGTEERDPDARMLCEIYSRNPAVQVITVDSTAKPRALPVAVHRCQALLLSTTGGSATISITDVAIAAASREYLDPKLDGIIGNTVVLQVSADRETPASIIVPEEYPNGERTVIVRYFVECFDPMTKESYPCEGGSPPIFIIPPKKR
jgi:hypothetical protein